MDKDISLKLAEKRYEEIESFIERMTNSIQNKELKKYFLSLVVYWIRGGIYIKDYKKLFDYEIFSTDDLQTQCAKVEKLVNFIYINIERNKE